MFAVMVVSLCGTCINLQAADKPASEGQLEARERAVTVNATAEVMAIDLAQRKVTLKGPDGNEVTVTVGEEVKRLAEIAQGDKVKVRYTTSFLVERREATDQEKQEPLAVVGVLGRGDPGEAPAGGKARIIKAVTKVVTLDQVNKSITVQGPLGGLLTAPVRDPKVLTTLKIGDTLVLTYTEAVALSLEKAGK
jgi:Cu/Ag efflux protein CusF